MDEGQRTHTTLINVSVSIETSHVCRAHICMENSMSHFRIQLTTGKKAVQSEKSKIIEATK